jgi:hypothetical protein
LNHTPGPWWIGDGSERTHYEGADTIFAKSGENGFDRVVCKLNSNFPLEFQANARLIAASPKLLDAVKKFLLLRDWVIEAGGADGPLPQATIREFAKMQLEVAAFADAVVNEAEGRP